MSYFYKDFNYITPTEPHGMWFIHLKDMVREQVLQSIEKSLEDKEMEDALVESWAATPDLPSEEPSKRSIRTTKTYSLTDEEDKELLMPVYDNITRTIRDINTDVWNYSIDSWESLQYCEYLAEDSGHFDWHIDPPARSAQHIQRKLSFSIGLSDHDDYEGGELQFRYGMEDSYVKIGRGEIVIFPSFILHRVTPVTEGKRRVVVGWGLGPNFV